MEPLYLNIGQSVELDVQSVTLGDIAKMSCADKKIISRLKTVKIINIKDKSYGRYVISVLAIIEKIHEVYPTLEIVNIGESQFLLTYRAPKKINVAAQVLKIAALCIAAFFGAAFTIMTFNNDVGVAEVFKQVYEQFMGKESNGFTPLEISYSIGIAVGIIGFFNHIFGRKLTVDPTPLEIEMKKYENDINSMLIDTCTREESMIDVD